MVVTGILLGINLQKLIRKNKQNSVQKSNEKNRIPNFDIIFIDEAQDLTPLYCRLVKMIIKHNKKNPLMVIIGDKRQMIYEYNHADDRFMLYGDKIFTHNNLPWQTLSLTTSYRMTDRVASFLNTTILKNLMELIFIKIKSF